MSKSGLRITAVALAAGIVAVLLAGFDDLPRSERARIATERKDFAAARSRVQRLQQQYESDMLKHGDVFSLMSAPKNYPARMAQAASGLDAAGQTMADLEKLDKANRRSDAAKVEALIEREKQARASAVAAAEALHTDYMYWVELWFNPPAAFRLMTADYRTIHDADIAGAAAVAQKAEADWPEKKADLESRLAAVREAVARADAAWQQSAEDRDLAAINDMARLHKGPFFAAAETLKTTAAEVPAKLTLVRTLSGQLYESWDKILADMETRGSTGNREYQQKIKTIHTRVTDASGKSTSITSDEKWVPVSLDQYQAHEKNLGMAIEHKAAGKYDTESEHIAQPAGFAYMAPQGQRNQYGYWEQRNGSSFWVFYGQYALMRDLFWGPSYRPIEYREYRDYSTYRERRETYYGREASGQGQRYGTAGASTQERYSGSTFSKSGGFKDSKFASKPGGYRDSQYSTPAARTGGDTSGRKFGSGSSGSNSQPRAQPQSSPSRNFRPAPSSRPSAPRSSPGRTFGSRRR